MDEEGTKKEPSVEHAPLNGNMVESSIEYLSRFTDFGQTLFHKLTGYAVVAADFDGKVLAFNQGAVLIYGYAPEEVVGVRNMDIFFSADFIDSGKLQAAVATLVKNEIFSYEGGMLKKDATEFPAQVSFALTKNRDGKLVGFVMIAQDLTEQKRNERVRARLESERKYHELFQQLHDAAFLADPETGTIVDCNEQAETLLSRPRYEIIGTHQSRLYPPDRAMEYDSLFARHATMSSDYCASRVANLDGEVVGKDGNPVPVAISWGVQILGGKRFVLGLFRDISERKRMEAELRKSNEDLRQSLQKLRIAQKQMVISEKLASVGQLAAGVCHEILNPINAISLYVQILARKNQDAHIVETMEKIKAEISRVTKITGSLMTFARKGGGVAKKVCVVEELESVLALIERELQFDNIKIARDFTVEPLSAQIDPDEMRQVFFNIVNNARYAMRGGGTLTVAAERVRGENDRCFIRIKFTDTGVGIKRENLDRIFDPFFTTKPEGQGTGMGLAIIHALIEKMGGTITVESEEGMGAIFTIDLPGETGAPVSSNQTNGKKT